MFPVQTITTVDSSVVQLDYLDGRLLISSLTRSFLCDTERYIDQLYVIGYTEFKNWKGLRNSLTQSPQFNYTDIHKEPAVCKLTLESRKEIADADSVKWVTKRSIHSM